MKRFTETDKWRDSWFRKLTAEHKLAYLYALDNCDAAGVWEADYELAEFVLGCKPDWPGLIGALGDRLEIIRGGKWWLNRFISYQYGTLSEDCKPHQHVLKVLKSHTLSIPFKKGIYTLKDKDKDKEQDKDKDKETEKTSTQIRVEAIFHRRINTPLSIAEARAWKAARAGIESTSQEDFELLEAYYAEKEDKDAPLYRRKNLETLLNNFAGEIDRARQWQAARGKYAGRF